MVREAVTNVVRHSGAARCDITVDGTPERVRLTVTDDGTGASIQPPGTGPGLKGLTERLARRAAHWRRGRSRGGFTVGRLRWTRAVAQRWARGAGDSAGAPA